LISKVGVGVSIIGGVPVGVCVSNTLVGVNVFVSGVLVQISSVGVTVEGGEGDGVSVQISSVGVIVLLGVGVDGKVSVAVGVGVDTSSHGE